MLGGACKYYAIIFQFPPPPSVMTSLTNFIPCSLMNLQSSAIFFEIVQRLLVLISSQNDFIEMPVDHIRRYYWCHLCLASIFLYLLHCKGHQLSPAKAYPGWGHYIPHWIQKYVGIYGILGVPPPILL